MHWPGRIWANVPGSLEDALGKPEEEKYLGLSKPLSVICPRGLKPNLKPADMRGLDIQPEGPAPLHPLIQPKPKEVPNVALRASGLRSNLSFLMAI